MSPYGLGGIFFAKCSRFYASNFDLSGKLKSNLELKRGNSLRHFPRKMPPPSAEGGSVRCSFTGSHIVKLLDFIRFYRTLRLQTRDCLAEPHSAEGGGCEALGGSSSFTQNYFFKQYYKSQFNGYIFTTKYPQTP